MYCTQLGNSNLDFSIYIKEASFFVAAIDIRGFQKCLDIYFKTLQYN